MGFLKSMFSFNGFMSRSEYWKAIILYIWAPAVVMVFLAILAGVYHFNTSTVVIFGSSEITGLRLLVWLLALYEVVANTYCIMAIMAKRLRDFSITPWMALLFFIPPLTPFVVILFGMFPTNVNAYER